MSPTPLRPSLDGPAASPAAGHFSEKRGRRPCPLLGGKQPAAPPVAPGCASEPWHANPSRQPRRGLGACRILLVRCLRSVQLFGVDARRWALVSAQGSSVCRFRSFRITAKTCFGRRRHSPAFERTEDFGESPDCAARKCRPQWASRKQGRHHSVGSHGLATCNC